MYTRVPTNSLRSKNGSDMRGSERARAKAREKTRARARAREADELIRLKKCAIHKYQWIFALFAWQGAFLTTKCLTTKSKHVNQLYIAHKLHTHTRASSTNRSFEWSVNVYIEISPIFRHSIRIKLIYFDNHSFSDRIIEAYNGYLVLKSIRTTFVLALSFFACLPVCLLACLFVCCFFSFVQISFPIQVIMIFIAYLV